MRTFAYQHPQNNFIEQLLDTGTNCCINEKEQGGGDWGDPYR